VAGLEGRILDHYRVVELVGQGGMASVYRAQDTHRNRVVAIKVLSQAISGDKQFVRRFRREAGILRNLKHPNIVSVLDYGESQGVVYLVMPFVVGETLYEWINRGKLTDAESGRWIGQVAEALEFAHSQGVIHRDVKPANILIDKVGNARLTDFGLARLIEDPNSLTGSMLMGTPAFISPEQAKGQKLGPRSDQYSLGVVCFLMATGRLPFESDSPMGTVLMHLQDPVPLPRIFRPDLPEPVERVILKAMAKDPEDRFAHILEMSLAFQAALAGKSVSWVEAPFQGVPREGPSRASQAPAAAPARQARARSTAGMLIAVAGVAAVAIGAFLLAPRFVEGGQPDATPTSEAMLSASVSPPPTARVFPTEAPPAQPTPTATPVLSALCPTLRMFGFERQESRVSWSVENAGDAVVRFAKVEPRFPKDNPPDVYLGGELLVRAGSASAGETVIVAAFDQVEIGPGEIRQLSISYPWAISEPGHAIRLTFDNDCVLETDW